MVIDRPIDPVEAMFWGYVRGDVDVVEFESWVYKTEDLEIILGPEDYLAVAACDYRDMSYKAKDDRIKIARDIVTRRFPRRCKCLSLPNSFGQTLCGPSCIDEHATRLARRTPWIETLQCQDCGTCWLQGTDTVDDDYYLHRLTPDAAQDIVERDRWPSILDNQPNLWPPSRFFEHYGFDSLEAWRAVHDPSRKRDR